MSKKRLRVISRHGEYNFQTGMITATLLQRGVPMDEAFELARQLRALLSGREQITTLELEEALNQLVNSHLGPDWDEERIRTEPATVLVRSTRGRLPFSRGIFLRQMASVGVDTDTSTLLLAEVLAWLSQRSQPEMDQDELDRFLHRMLGRTCGSGFARRFRLMRWLAREEQPVIIFIGGSTGTGKSTLAMELGFRLGVRIQTSTDMIRETMRAVLSPEFMPGLHDHSFRGMQQGGSILRDPRERVLAGFRQQAEQVSVGIRAVVQRAIREGVSIIVEGTHILPPFDQYVPEGSRVYTAGLMLAVPEQAEHLARFPRRASQERDPQPYLNSFQAVRWIHDDLLALAENRDEVVVLARGDPEQTATAALSYLSQALPVDAAKPDLASEPPEREQRPALFLILDGLGDDPIPQLGDQTPLAAAHTPVLDSLAATGAQGLATIPWKAIHPNTADAMAVLLGLDEGPGNLGRGLLEAMGSGLPIPRPSVVFRGNLATAEADGRIRDRRAGRIRETGAMLGELQRIPLPGDIRGSVLPGHEHRVTVVLQGEGLSKAVSNTDPGNEAKRWRIRRARALDDSPEAERTATALNALLDLAARHLENHDVNTERAEQGLPVANRVITRGSAHTDDIPPMPASSRAAVVAGCRTVLGVGRLTGMQVATSPRMTGSLDTDLDAKFAAAASLLQAWPTVIVHIKGTDVAAHDKKFEAKQDFIAQVDAALGRFLDAQPEGLRILLSADHGTSSISGVHMHDPPPVLLATWRHGLTETATFSEASARHGALGMLDQRELFDLLEDVPAAAKS